MTVSYRNPSLAEKVVGGRIYDRQGHAKRGQGLGVPEAVPPNGRLWEEEASHADVSPYELV